MKESILSRIREKLRLPALGAAEGTTPAGTQPEEALLREFLVSPSPRIEAQQQAPQGPERPQSPPAPKKVTVPNVADLRRNSLGTKVLSIEVSPDAPIAHPAGR